jgi:hypothetical protein
MNAERMDLGRKRRMDGWMMAFLGVFDFGDGRTLKQLYFTIYMYLFKMLFFCSIFLNFG